MRLLHQLILGLKEGKSDKVYEVDLCELDAEQYVVNFRYGRRGGKLREGTKTKKATTLEKAQQLFTKLADEKRKKGYSDETEELSESYAALVEEQRAAKESAAKSSRRLRIVRKKASTEEAEAKPAEADDKETSEAPEPVRRLRPKRIRGQELVPAADEEKAPETSTPTQPKVAAKAAQEVVRAGSGAGSREEAILQWLRYYEEQGTQEPDKKPAWSLARVAERAGTLRLVQAAKHLAALLGDENNQQNVSIAWALGQCGGQEAIDALQKHATRSLGDALGRTIHEALFALLDGEARAQWQAQLFEGLPEAAREALRTPNAGSLEPWGTFFADEEADAWLYGLCLFDAHPQARFVLHGLLAAGPTTRRRTQLLREMLKASLYRGDEVLFATLFHRFDLGPLPYKKKAQRALRQELWRRLRTLGEVDEGQYLRLVAAALGVYTDEQLTADTGSLAHRFLAKEQHFGLWNKADEALLVSLFGNAQSDAVVDFARKLLKTRNFFSRPGSQETLKQLLHAHREEAQQLGLSWLESGTLKPDWLTVLLESTLPAVRTKAQEWLSKNIEELHKGSDWMKIKLAQSSATIYALLIHEDASVRELGTTLSTRYTIDAAQRKDFTAQCLRALCNDEDTLSDKAGQNIVDILEGSFARELRGVSEHLLESLMTQKKKYKKEFLARLFLTQDLSQLSDTLLLSLCNARSQALHEIGMRLLAKLTTEELRDKQDFLIKACLHGSSEVKALVGPMVEQLLNEKAAIRQPFASRLVAQLTF